MKFIKKYVISLEKDSYRRELFFKQNGTEDFSLFYAVNTMGREYSELSNFFDIEKFKERYGRMPIKGEIGCTLSHLVVYKKIWEDDTIALSDYCLVCEDDALLSPDFFNTLRDILEENLDDDLILLGESKTESFECDGIDKLYPVSSRFFSRKISDGYYYAYPYTPYYAGTVCYLIKKSAIANLLKSKPYWVADDYRLFDKEFGLRMVLIRPLIAIENPETQSNLEELRSIAQNQALLSQNNNNILYAILKKTVKRDFIKYFIKKTLANFNSIKKIMLYRF